MNENINETQAADVNLNPRKVGRPPKNLQTNEPKAFFLEANAREQMLNTLKEAKVECNEIDDYELVKKITELATNLQQNILATHRDIETLEKKLQVYRDGEFLTDVEFIKKLYFLNVPKIYLQLFRNQDAELFKIQANEKQEERDKIARKKIWERIRFSNIKQIDHDDLVQALARQQPRIKNFKRVV